MSNYSFPGYQRTRDLSVTTYDIEVGDLNVGGILFHIKVMRSLAAPNGFFLISEIHYDKEKLWDFKSCGYGGIGVLAMAGEEAVVTLIEKGKSGKVERVIPLEDLRKGTLSDLGRLCTLKRLSSEYLGREAKFSSAEQAMEKVTRKRHFDEEEKRREEEREQRRQERIRRAETILARSRVTGYSPEGKIKFGPPVVGNEWESLPKGSAAVLVDSIAEDGTAGKMIEWFIVGKAPGRNPFKEGVIKITSSLPEVKTKESHIPVMTSLVIEREGGFYEVVLFGSKDEWRSERETIPLGSYTAFNPVGSTSVEVYVKDREGMRTLGKCKVVSFA